MSNITATGNYTLDKAAGKARIHVAVNDRTQAGVTDGAWGGTTCYIQYQNEEGNWVDHPNGTFTANFSKVLDAVAENYRLVFSGGSGIDLDMDEEGSGGDWRD